MGGDGFSSKKSEQTEDSKPRTQDNPLSLAFCSSSSQSHFYFDFKTNSLCLLVSLPLCLCLQTNEESGLKRRGGRGTKKKVRTTEG